MITVAAASVKMWETAFKLNGVEVGFIRDGVTIPVTAILDNVDELAEVLYSNLKITSEIVGITVSFLELGIYPRKGDKFTFNGKTYVLVPIGGEDFCQWTDTSRYTLKVAGYKE